MLIAPLILEIIINEEDLFSLLHPDLPKYHIFPQFKETFYSSLKLSQNFNCLAKTKTSKAHSSFSSKNELSMKRNYFLCYSQIYPNITFNPNFPELFILLFSLAKILIFRSKPKLERLIALLVQKMNDQ